MMKYDRAFSREEGRLLAAALKARQFRRPLPPGMGERLQARIRAAEGGGARWWKVAASVAAVASFAAFAATVVVKFAGGEDKTAEPGAFAEAAEVAAEETFEEIFSEELAVLRKQEEEQAMNTRAVRGLAAGALVAATAFSVPSAQGAVRSSVFDDVKVWYKGSAGNAVGTKDSSSASKVKNLPSLAESSSAMHGGAYKWWGWRVQYKNEKVDCPYAGTTLDSTPCMAIPKAQRKLSDGSYSDEPTGYTDVTVGGKTTSQPYWIGARFDDLTFSNWMSDWPAGSVCSNWTCVLRFRSDKVSQVSGNENTIIKIGSSSISTAGAATGVNLTLNSKDTLGSKSYFRPFVGNKNTLWWDDKYLIEDHRWIDAALVVNGAKLDIWFCWNAGTEEAPTNRLAKVSETYTGGWPTISAGCKVYLGCSGSGSSNGMSYSYTNGVYSASLDRHAFCGAFHQIAFWDRTLSDDEIREAMAGGTSRPNLVQVGIEGNGIKEFAATPTKTSVATDGDWENLNPTLTAENPSATITFNCPALWAGLPQYLRLPMAGTSSSGAVDITLNGELLGTANVYQGKTSLVYIEENKILSGANTLVITRASGNVLVLDAVTLGGSWKFGESVTSFNDAAVNANTAAKVGADCWVFSPACGNDKFHARGTTWDIGGDTLSFPVFIPADLVGKVRGELLFKTATASSTCKFKWLLNNTELQGDTTGKEHTEYMCKALDGAFVDGWNNIVWNRQSSWINFSTFQFTVLPPVKGMMIIIK